MRIEFVRKPKQPEKMLCEVEIFFDADTPLHGMKLVGLTLWKGDRGVHLTVPARQYAGQTGEAKYFDFLRSADPQDRKAFFRFRDLVLEEYKKRGEQR